MLPKGHSGECAAVGAIPQWLWVMWFVLLTQPLLTRNSFVVVRYLPLRPPSLKGEVLGFLAALFLVGAICRWGAPWIRWRLKSLALGIGLGALFASVAGSAVSLTFFDRPFVLNELLVIISSTALGSLALWSGEAASWEPRPKLSDASLKHPINVLIPSFTLPTVWLLAVTPSTDVSPGDVDHLALGLYWAWSLVSTACFSFWMSNLLRDPNGDNRLIIGAFVVGIGLYGSMVRVGGTRFWTVLGAPIGPFLAAWIVVLLLHCAINRPVKVMASTDGESTCSPRAKQEALLIAAANELAQQVSLSQRETDVLIHLVQGRTSQEIAQELNLKASTVRTYMGRMAQKAACGSAAQLAAQVREAAGVTFITEKSITTTSNGSNQEPLLGKPQTPFALREQSVSRTPLFWGLLLLLLLMVPFDQGAGFGIYGAPQVFGIAWALLVFAANKFFGLYQCFIEYWGQAGQKRHVVFVVIAMVLVVGSALLLTGNTWISKPFGYGRVNEFPMLVFLAQFVLTLVAFSAFYLTSITNQNRKVIEMLCAQFVLVCIARLWNIGWVIFLYVAVVGLIYSAARTPRPSEAPVDEEASGSEPLDKVLSSSAPSLGVSCVALGGCGVGMGMIIEEAWRSLSAHNAVGLSMPFAICAIAATVMLSVRFTSLWGFRLSVEVVVAVIAAAFLGILQESCISLIDLVFLFISIAMLNTQSSNVEKCMTASAAHMPWFSLGMSGGILLAWQAVSVYGDLSSYNETAALAFGGQETLRLAVGFGFGLLACLTCACVIWAAIDINYVLEGQVIEMEYGDRLTQKSRIEAYLKARGLSNLQCQVLLGIVNNQTGREISRELGYSLGSINTARNEGYRLLGVHSKAQLIDCVVRGIGL